MKGNGKLKKSIHKNPHSDVLMGQIFYFGHRSKSTKRTRNQGEVAYLNHIRTWKRNQRGENHKNEDKF